ncbi:LysM peptidoglycan-binding domain-containing protein [Bacillus sp. S/N-304-OC-R1]|uniref:LysM peptidoglycan-binding domain-containing protein n=1 Tax=Bacillus sp. S/N-304-OC-R1 TaxID=2758034 RepID=UPI001C8D8A49|nr:LysM peptidoglycan-binding domain-containing protein [Bacillus sp. S/N-304-OC-R1]MBY0123959.1 LysM peptidoglycan-binding domain-containing protein [Bacillus sp. S/N-304-OC-R1]
MTSLSAKKEKLYLIVGAIIIVLLFFGLYFLYFQPLKSTLSNKQRELQTEEQLLSVIENQIKETASDSYEGTEALQKKIPVKPLVEQLLLDIEKAEVVSGSLVSNMEFSTGELEGDKTEDQQGGNGEESPVDQQGNNKPSIALPSGMKKTTVVLSVKSSNYFEMEKFIESLESENRVILVENLEINGQEEIVSADQEKQPIESEITISAFYMPTLTDLIDQLPKMEVPKTSDKKNPFSTSGSLSNQGDKVATNPTQNSNGEKPQGNNGTEQSVQKNNQSIVKYTVQPGDTLFRISMKFFKSRDGEKIIKEWNHLENEIVKTGEILEIPLKNNK